MADVRGSWELHEAIVTRWRSSGLDDAFLEEYGPVSNVHSILMDTMQDPDPTGPYCVFQVFAPTIDGYTSGANSSSEQQQYLDYAVQFRIIAKSTTTEAAKDIAQRLAAKVAESFKPSNPLQMPAGDKSIQTTQTSDNGFAGEGNDPQVWNWLLSYNIQIDATYDLPVEG